MEQKDSKKFLLARLLLALLVIFLVMYFVTIVTGYRPFYNNTAEKNAQVDVTNDAKVANRLIDARYNDLQKVASEIMAKKAPDEDLTVLNVTDVLESYVGSDTFGDLRYVSNGKIYDVHGYLVENEVEEITELISQNRRSCSNEYPDKMIDKTCIAFYIPMIGEEVIDGLVSVVEARNFIDTSEVLNKRARTVAVITESGYVLSDMVRQGEKFSVGNNYYDFIERVTQNKETSTDVLFAVREKDLSSVHVKIDGKRYTVAVTPLLVTDSQMYLVSLSLSEDLMEVEMGYLSHTISLLIIAILSLGVSLVYAWLYYNSSKKQIRYASYTYPNIECPNLEQFKLDAINTMRATPVTKYSIIAFKIKGFKSLNSHLGEKDTDELLRQSAKIFSGFCEANESYAYTGNGIFVLFFKYVDENQLARRINVVRAISSKNQYAISQSIGLRFNVGVCHAFGGTKSSVAEMVENALTACNLAKERTSTPYVVYDMSINENIAKDEKIETMMEEGLKNGDFKLFLQPKYNIKNDKIDSAEALVRWFDHEKGDYIFPSEFIGLFETNGFITKLDHFMYIEVLKYFKKAVERGNKIVPISVNVSRVTATAKDFLSFYIDNKKKYNVGDGFIVLEFTESFAVEDNDSILYMVEELHKNGIGCSLDDFGSGYSSFNVLKNIPFDELKLDKCFLDEGYDKNRDEKMLDTVITLCKSLGTKIVQEGVETEEMLNKVASYGCDVAQGFYYAKAIPLEEYKIFVETNTSIVYKSKVK